MPGVRAVARVRRVSGSALKYTVPEAVATVREPMGSSSWERMPPPIRLAIHGRG